MRVTPHQAVHTLTATATKSGCSLVGEEDDQKTWGKQTQQREAREKLEGFMQTHGVPEHHQSGPGAQSRHSLVLVVLHWLSFWRGLKSCVVLVIPKLVEIGLSVILRHQGLRVHASLGTRLPSAMMTPCIEEEHTRGARYSPPRPSFPMGLYKRPALCCECMKAACPHIRLPGTAPGGPTWPRGPCPSQHRTSGHETSARCCCPPTAP